jgi:hypothetical protein
MDLNGRCVTPVPSDISVGDIHIRLCGKPADYLARVSLTGRPNAYTVAYCRPHLLAVLLRPDWFGRFTLSRITSADQR